MTESNLTKQILYRSKHRGCKETDHLLGKFVEENLASFSADKLNLLKEFLLEDDAIIYDWLLAKESIPQHYQPLIDEIRNFHNIL
jgi:antitoxin CptB